MLGIKQGKTLEKLHKKIDEFIAREIWVFSHEIEAFESAGCLLNPVISLPKRQNRLFQAVININQHFPLVKLVLSDNLQLYQGQKAVFVSSLRLK